MNKICTSIEQSKKLIELGIDVNTADMVYCIELYKEGWKYSNEAYPIDGTLEGDDIPAWSLVALLGILKYPTLTQDVENKWHITDWTGFYPKSKYGFDSPIDACYEMIIWLLENKKYETT